MAFVPGTATDDIIIPTANGNTYLAFAGDDTYIITKAPSAGATMVITDIEGANKIQLVDGLTIASSIFFADAVELTLANGAKFQITSASKFSFDVGANLTTGDKASGSYANQSFAQFASTLGVASLPTGGTSATGTPNFLVPTGDEGIAPTFTISGAASAAEGTTATYTVKLSTPVATGSTTVDYAITFLNGATASDITGALTGTLTFAANETSKTITVPVVLDSSAETTKEAIVVTLSNPSTGALVGALKAVTTEIVEVPLTFTMAGADSVFEGANATYTVTASRPVDADTVVGFVVTPGDATAINAGTSKTNLSDFDEGAFNTFNATIKAGQTTATYTVSARQDGQTELEETFSVAATVAGTPLGTKTTVLKDGNGSGGKVMTLTIGVDTGNPFIGTSGNDTYNAFSVGSAETLTAFDSIDGNSGTDTLNVVSGHAAAFTVPATVTVKNVEIVNIAGDSTVTANISNWTGLTQLNVTATGGDSVSAASDVAILASDTLSSGSININGGSSVTAIANQVTSGSINIGTTTAPTGPVTVNTTITGTTTAGSITVIGGTTINVTQVAANPVNTDTTNAQVYVSGRANTSSVTVSASPAATRSSTVNGVFGNSVIITDVNAGDATKVGTIGTISVDGFTSLNISDTGLTSLNLGHGSGNIVIDNSGLTKNTNTTLALALNGQTGGTLDDADIYTTLNVTTGATKSTLANITDSALTTLTLAGSSVLTLTSTAGLTSLKTATISGAAGITANLSGATVTSVDTTASTGTSTVTVDGSKATFTGGAGVDKVTLAATTPTKAIATGAGDDTVDLTAISGSSSLSVNGGLGTDTLRMTAALAATASANSTFAGAVTNFEALVLTAATSQTVDLKVLGNFSHVSTAGGNGLTLNYLPAGGTLALTGAGTAYSLGNSESSGGSNGLIKLELSDSSGSGVAFASAGITASGVEAFAITTIDGQATPSGAFSDSLTLLGNSLKTLTVGGNAGLTLSATSTALTTLDASGLTLGGFTWTSGALAAAAVVKGGAKGTNTVDFTAATGGAVTYTGGTGNDVVSGSNGKNNVITLGDGNNSAVVSSGNNTITGGAGNDTVTATSGNNTVNLGNGTNAFTATSGDNTYTGGTGLDTVTLGSGQNVITTGAGNDVIVLTTAPTSGNAYTVITDPAPGDSISMPSHGTEIFQTTKISLAGTAVFQDYLDAAVAGYDAYYDASFKWFQFLGNTYLVQDLSSSATFTNGVDFVVQLTGLIDLSTVTGVGTNTLTLS